MKEIVRDSRFRLILLAKYCFFYWFWDYDDCDSMAFSDE